MTQDPATPEDTTSGPAAPEPAAEPTSEPTTAPSAALAELEGLEDLPVGAHVERFTQVHDALRARLDGAPGGDGGGPDAGPGR
ncbi:hypothetical protein AAG589_05375 [Isoptericola sp. F-RaC21]|uniref:hypothetical protein n=1 Tax=Isoptericola sp. F-RaC21 TaxID=3141452 RepID=UPI00315C2A15